MTHPQDCNPNNCRYSGTTKICECGILIPTEPHERLDRIRRKAIKFDVAAFDQSAKTLIENYIPLIASVFRKFCTEDGLSRADARELTIAYMHTPPYIHPNEDEQS